MALALEGNIAKSFMKLTEFATIALPFRRQVGKHRIKHTSPASSVRSILRVSYSKQRS